MAKEFDIVVYGATGFTGSLIYEYLVTNYANNSIIRLALAGRNENKLKIVREKCGADDAMPIILADADDLDSLRAMAKRTRLVISCTGPFLLYGSNVVRACAETGTDYVDVTGEVYWVGQMIKEYANKAEESGARIVSCCGFDSVPFDLGVYYLQKLANENFGHPVSRVKGRVESLLSGPGGGSHASMAAGQAEAKINKNYLKFMFDPFALTPGVTGPDQPGGMEPIFDKELNSWAAPWVMSAVNPKIIHRSNALLGYPYGEDFVYDEMTSTGPGEEGKAKISDTIRTLSGFNPDGRVATKPGEGPSKEVMEAGYYSLGFSGIIGDEVAIKVLVSDDLDPGFGSTAKLVGESALCLLQDDVQIAGGMWTPVAAMGEQLLHRLPENGALKISHTIK